MQHSMKDSQPPAYKRCRKSLPSHGCAETRHRTNAPGVAPDVNGFADAAGERDNWQVKAAENKNKYCKPPVNVTADTEW